MGRQGTMHPVGKIGKKAWMGNIDWAVDVRENCQIDGSQNATSTNVTIGSNDPLPISDPGEG